MSDDSSPAILRLRADRLRLQREVADALKASSDTYLTYVKPHAADARMLQGAPKGRGLGVTKVLSMDVAEKLDRTTPTGAFEYGRALMAVWDETIRRKRSQLKAVEENLRKALEEKARGGADPLSDAIRRAWGSGEGSGWPPALAGGRPDDLSGLAAERLGRLRRLVHDARGGLAGV